MLEIGKANEVKFKVGVNGTQANPTVRLIIGTPEAEISFKAEKLIGSEDGWFSEVLVPEDLAAGEYDFRVEVILNNRLFTPIKRKVMIGRPEPVAAAESQAPHPTQKPKQTETWEGEGGALPEVPEVPQPLPAAPVPPVEKKKPQGIFKEAANTEKAKPVKLEVLSTKKKPARTVTTPLPKPLKTKPEPIRIKMSEIAAESDKRFDKVLKESPSYRKPGVAVTPISITQQTPVTLKKGEIIYE